MCVIVLPKEYRDMQRDIDPYEGMKDEDVPPEIREKRRLVYERFWRALEEEYAFDPG